MRQGINAPVWLLGNHLGSTSVVVNASGVVQSTQLYKPWGESRYSSSASPTKYLYTGQMKEGALGGVEGLYYYGARWYDPSLGRFAQADTIIPEASQGTQAWDRYAYTNNNPVRYNDPSGHCIGPLMIACVVVAEAMPYIMVAVGAVLAFGAIPGDSRVYKPPPGAMDPGLQFVAGVELALTGYVAIPPASTQNSSSLEAVSPITESSIKIPTIENSAPLVESLDNTPKIKPGSSGGPTAGKPFSANLKQQAFDNDLSRTCVWCGMPNTATQVDHAIPKSLGGNATIDNAQLSCPHCNLSRGARDSPVTPPPDYRGPWPPPWWPN
jgi:RHS repeat-associated protein